MQIYLRDDGMFELFEILQDQAGAFFKRTDGKLYRSVSEDDDTGQNDLLMCMLPGDHSIIKLIEIE